MSKRFGRNQRRRMRERIAELELQVVQMEDLAQRQDAETNEHLQRASRLERDMHSLSERIRRVLGDFTSMLPPTEAATSKAFDVFPVEHKRIDSRLYPGEALRATVHHLERVDVGSALDPVRMAMHVNVRVPGLPGLAYYLSQEAVLSGPPDELARYLTQTFTRRIEDEAKAVRQRKT